MRVAVFVGKRVVFVVPQLLGITIVTFLIVRLLPGDPARLLTGPFATQATIDALRKQLGLTKSWPEQFWIYIKHLLTGDWGNSFATGNSVLHDIGQRLPATLELVTISLLLMTVLGIGLGVLVATRRARFVDRLTFLYGLLAGAIPDFWLGLVLTYVFFFKLGWAPAPIGRIDIGLEPHRVTGFYTIDTLIEGNWSAFSSAIQHLILPVLTLVFVYTGAILKMTRSTIGEMLESDFVVYAKAAGLSSGQRLRYMLRNALPPVVTVVAITYSFLLGGAVLVENVFSWGGLGQYAVHAVTQSDYSAVQGFVLVAAIFNLVVYLIVDICYVLLDPRIEV